MPLGQGFNGQAVHLVDPVTGEPYRGGESSVTYANNSITNATGASQTLLNANTSRKALIIHNPMSSTTSWVINPVGGTAASGTMPEITLNPGDEWNPTPPPTNAITGIGTAASKLTVLEG